MYLWDNSIQNFVAGSSIVERAEIARRIDGFSAVGNNKVPTRIKKKFLNALISAFQYCLQEAGRFFIVTPRTIALSHR